MAVSRVSPCWAFDDSVHSCVIGVDEVGRGPLFGPVVAAAVHIPRAVRPILSPLGIDDSKRVSPLRRVHIFRELIIHAQIGLGAVSAGEIDCWGIGQASLLAMTRALASFEGRAGLVLVDGCQCPKGLTLQHQAIVKGDQKSVAIAAASIVAKVTRDQAMVAFDRLWPGYGLIQHKGYPTKAHRDAIRQQGITPAHRRSFSGCRA